MVGLRGVGKTVLLDRMRESAEGSGIHTLRIEAPEHRSLPAILAPQLRQSLLRLSRNAKAKDLAERALRALAGFAGMGQSLQPTTIAFLCAPGPSAYRQPGRSPRDLRRPRRSSPSHASVVATTATSGATLPPAKGRF